MTVVDGLIQLMTGLTPDQQKASRDKWVAGTGDFAGFNVILNGVTAVSPMPSKAWDYIAIEPINRDVAIGSDTIGEAQVSIEIGVKTDQKSDTSQRKIEEKIEAILSPLRDNAGYIQGVTMGVSSMRVNYQIGIDKEARPFARYANIDIVFRVPAQF